MGEHFAKSQIISNQVILLHVICNSPLIPVLHHAPAHAEAEVHRPKLKYTTEALYKPLT